MWHLHMSSYWDLDLSEHSSSFVEKLEDIYVRCLRLGFLGGQSDAGDLKCLCVLSIQSHCFLAEIRMETAWYLEMYDVSFGRHTQISHVRLGQQQQSLSCDVILLEDFGILLQLSITYTAHTNTHAYVSVIAGTLSVNWINFIVLLLT